MLTCCHCDSWNLRDNPGWQGGLLTAGPHQDQSVLFTIDGQAAVLQKQRSLKSYLKEADCAQCAAIFTEWLGVFQGVSKFWEFLAQSLISTCITQEFWILEHCVALLKKDAYFLSPNRNYNAYKITHDICDRFVVTFGHWTTRLKCCIMLFSGFPKYQEIARLTVMYYLCSVKVNVQ
jgi:hypothetical protein